MLTGAKFMHLGVAVSDITTAKTSFEQLLGYTLERGPFMDPIQRVSVGFLSPVNDHQPIIELVAPYLEPSPIANYLRKAIGAYHMCYEVEDLSSAMTMCRDSGCIVVAEPSTAIAFDNRPVSWLYTPAKLLLELLQR